MPIIMSEAAERIRSQLADETELVRADVAELLEDYDALNEVHMRVMRNLETMGKTDETKDQMHAPCGRDHRMGS